MIDTEFCKILIWSSSPSSENVMRPTVGRVVAFAPCSWYLCETKHDNVSKKTRETNPTFCSWSCLVSYYRRGNVCLLWCCGSLDGRERVNTETSVDLAVDSLSWISEEHVKCNAGCINTHKAPSQARTAPVNANGTCVVANNVQPRSKTHNP